MSDAGDPAMRDLTSAWGDERVFGPQESAVSRTELAPLAARDGLTRRQLDQLAREGWHRSQLGLTRTVCQPVDDDGRADRDDGDPWRWL
jgi:hypothetical protein